MAVFKGTEAQAAAAANEPMVAEPVPPSRVAIRDIAASHGVRRQTVHKVVKRHGIRPTRLRSEDARGQRVSCITQDEYDRIKSDLDAPVDQADVHQGEVDAVFYLLLTEPNADPRRFKVGFATDVSERIRKFKTIAPYVRLVKTWPCKAHWEKAAIAARGKRPLAEPVGSASLTMSN